MGQLDVDYVGYNLVPWTYLFDIRKEVAQEMHLDMGNMFGYKATQLCWSKMETKSGWRARSRRRVGGGWASGHGWWSTNHGDQKLPGS